jgi:hypothetical protein
MSNTVVGVFKDPEHVNSALRDLDEMGYTESDVSVITPKQTLPGTDEESANLGEAVGKGGLIGGLIGLLAGVGALALPGLGALFIGGPLAAAFGLTGAAATTASGAITGALAGGLVGALQGLGFSEGEAERLEKHIKEGHTVLMVVAPENRQGEVEDVMRNHGGEDIKTTDLKL